MFQHMHEQVLRAQFLEQSRSDQKRPSSPSRRISRRAERAAREARLALARHF
jgi:hypothetical protein